MSRSRKTSVLDDLFDLLIELPTWAGPVVIFGVFAAFRWLFPWMLDALSPGTDVGKISTPIFSQAAIILAPVVAGLATVVWIVAIFKKPRRAESRIMRQEAQAGRREDFDRYRSAVPDVVPSDADQMTEE